MVLNAVSAPVVLRLSYLRPSTELTLCRLDCNVLIIELSIEFMITMKELFKSLKEDFEGARALWIINNMDLIEGYAKVKYTFLAYLQMVLYCLTLPYQFIKILVQKSKGGNNEN